MKLDRTTYELFIIDYLEGQLDAIQVSELLLFLEQNPDLKAEIEGIEHVSLNPDSVVNSLDKKSLKKPEKIALTPALEELMVAVLEADATPAEQNHLTELVATFPNLRKDYHWFTQTKLETNFAVVFPQKRTLKKYRIGLWYQISAVAAVFIACLIIATLYIKPTSTNIEANLKSTPKSTAQVKDNPLQSQTASLAQPQKTKHQIVQVNKPSKLVKSTPITCSLIATNQTPTLTVTNKLELKTENRQVIVFAANKANTDDFINANEWLKNKVAENTNPNSLLTKFNQLTGAGIILEKDSFSGKLKRFEITSLGLALNK